MVLNPVLQNIYIEVQMLHFFLPQNNGINVQDDNAYFRFYIRIFIYTLSTSIIYIYAMEHVPTYQKLLVKK